MALLQARGPERVLPQARARLPARALGPGLPELQPARVQVRVQVRAQQVRARVQPGPVLQAPGQRYPFHRRCYRRQAPMPVQARRLLRL